MKQTINFISAMLLLVLILFKVSNFHTYSHLDEVEENPIEHCEGCELAIENQHTPALLQGEIAIQQPPVLSVTGTIPSYVFDIFMSELDHTICSRPPPFLV